jgi:hypothetical protein
LEFLHVGMKVNDIHKSMAMFRTLFGITWEPVKEYSLTDITLMGMITPCTTLVTHGKTASGFEIEMIQVTAGRTADNLVVGDGEGLTHFGFLVEDVGAAVAKAGKWGLRSVCEYNSEYVDFAFVEGPSLGGPLAQLIHFKQSRKTHFPPAHTAGSPHPQGARRKRKRSSTSLVS